MSGQNSGVYYMQIDGLKNSAMSFQAIHPARYYVRCEDGRFHHAVSGDVVKTLQRKIVAWLNKDYNDEIRLTTGKPVKKESIGEKAIRERLVRFFINRDTDYRTKRVVRSFNTTNSLRETESYILTGKSAEIVENEAQSIRNFHGDIRDRAEGISEYYGIEVDKVKKYISDKAESQEMAVKRGYHDNLKKLINKFLQMFDPKNSLFEVYFIPKVKGKNVKYELVDAKLNHK